MRRLAQCAPIGLTLMVLAGCATQAPGVKATIGHQTLNVARSALAGGNPRMAVTVTTAVLKSNPNDPEALIDRGDAYFMLQNCVDATADYRHALTVTPRATAAELGLGRCALPTDPRAAEAAFGRATRDDPENAVAFNDLGIALADQSDFAAAEQAFQSALVIDPALQAAQVNRGLALALGGQPAQAAVVLGALARSTTATAKIRADYATALVLAGQPADATTVLSKDMPSAEAVTTVADMRKLDTLPTAAAPKAPASG
jgi:Flp pilus assembly protein TadD